uniref:Uroplakin-1b n=1 Tax=Meleagris gallopavo TaxID=9103 RepID=A0A803YJW4_MELGA
MLCVFLAPAPYILLFSLLCVKLGVVGGTAFQFSSWILKQANPPTYLLCMATYLHSSFYSFLIFFVCFCFCFFSCCLFICFLLQLTPNLFLKQMLERYLKSDADNNNDKWMTEGVTKTWDNLMLQNQCCGVNGPSDWQEYTSAFRVTHNDADYPWPHNCCVMDNRGEPINLDGCKLGVPGFYNSNGCYDAISGPLNRQAWGVAWFGFAILCWTFCVLLGTMFYWSRIAY